MKGFYDANEWIEKCRTRDLRDRDDFRAQLVCEYNNLITL